MKRPDRKGDPEKEMCDPTARMRSSIFAIMSNEVIQTTPREDNKKAGENVVFNSHHLRTIERVDNFLNDVTFQKTSINIAVF
jgi:hypothetical protein